MEPDIRYARSGGVSIAYQVVGDGDVDLAYVPDYVSNLVYGWQSLHWRRFYQALARSFRLILFDKRGTGLSDLGGHYPALETRMEDLHAVLDAAGSERTVLLGSHDGCSLSALYAATYPERTRAIVLFHPASHSEWLQESTERDLADLRERWGTQEYFDEILEMTCRTLANSEEDRLWFANWPRVGASPSVAVALNRAWFETDLRDVLPAVRVPTLVLYREGLAEHDSREVARLIPGAHEAKLGDRAWRELLERHHALVRRELTRYRGNERDTAGDGFFATFYAPARAIRCAQAVVYGVRELGLQVRAGLHTGECEVHEDKVAGLAVVIGARVAALAEGGEVLVSKTVKDLVAGAGVDFAERGTQKLKGVPGEWKLYAVRAI